MADPPNPLTRDEVRAALEAIVRDSTNDAARISAIRQLREMWREDEVGGDHPTEQPEGFDALDEAPARRTLRSA